YVPLVSVPALGGVHRRWREFPVRPCASPPLVPARDALRRHSSSSPSSSLEHSLPGRRVLPGSFEGEGCRSVRTAIEPPAAHHDTQAPAASDADGSPPANRVTSITLRPDSTRPGPGAADTEPR